jgi:long-chain fatty acid transport protein
LILFVELFQVESVSLNIKGLTWPFFRKKSDVVIDYKEGKQHMIKREIFLFFVAHIAFLLLPATSYSGNPVHGAKAAAMGTAFVGVADDPSAIAYNPAGITQLKGTDIYGGVTAVIPSTTYTSPSGQEEKTDFQVFYPPNLYATSDFGMRDVTIGLGIFSPFGIGGRKWSKDGLTRYISTESMIATLWINPTVAYQVAQTLSIGAGVEYMIARNDAKRMVNQSALGAADGELDLNATGDGWGYDFGVLFKPDEKISLGIAYRSRVKVSFSGTAHLSNIAPAAQPLFGGATFDTPIHTDSTFPDILSFGAAYRPSKRMTLSFDLEEVRWSSFKSIDIELQNQVPAAGFTSSSNPLDWKDILTIKFGAEYLMSERFALRGGYAYVTTPVPDHTLSPSNPDSNQHNICIGFGYKKEKMVVDFFYIAGFYERRTVNNAILNGTYDNFVQYTGVNLGYRF